MTSTSSTAVSLCGCLTIGCGLVVGGDPLGDEGDSIADDLAQYEELAAALEAEREQALGEQVTAVATAGPWLAWLDGQTLGLRRYPDGLELELPAPDPSYRVGATQVLTAERSDDLVIVRGYALPGGEAIDERSFAAPSWPLAALLADEAVLVEPDSQRVWAWRLGLEPPVELGTLAEAGVAIEQLEQLEAVTRESERSLLLRADGQLWVLARESFSAVAVAEIDELLAVDPRGALFTRGDALWLYELDGATVRIDTAIADSGWSLNATFARIHEYTGAGATLADDRVIYIGSAGVFAYALDQEGPDAITPILIEPRWDVAAGIPRVEYRELRFAGGTVFARGLIDAHGEIGETGPIFAVRYP